MSNYVNNFIESLNLSDDCKNLARVLITCRKDCESFYIGYLGRNAYPIDDLLDYRESKISIADMSFDNFVEICDNKGIKEGFEKTFLHYFSPQAVRLIESMIGMGKTSLKEIHSLFVRNPNENILKNVL